MLITSFVAAAQTRRAAAPRTQPARTTAATTVTANTGDPLTALPASDAVMYVDVNRIMSEMVPRVLAESPERLAQLNAGLDSFRTQTGIDPRSLDRIAIGMRYTTPRAGVTKLDTVAVARGRFNAGTLIAAGRLAMKGKYTEQQYGGRSINVFTLDAPMRMFGVSIGELAVTALDANTIAFGSPQVVRATIDTTRSTQRANNAAIIALATRNQNALLGFSGNVPAGLLEGVQLGNPEITRSLAPVRQVFGSLALSNGNYEMLTTARTTDANAARALNETLDALRGLGGMFVGNLTGERGRLAQSALNSLRLTTENTDVTIRVALSEADIATLVRGRL